MTKITHNQAKDIIKPYRLALYDLDGNNAFDALNRIASKAQFQHCHPFGNFVGSENFYQGSVQPLINAF